MCEIYDSGRTIRRGKREIHVSFILESIYLCSLYGSSVVEDQRLCWKWDDTTVELKPRELLLDPFFRLL